MLQLLTDELANCLTLTMNFKHLHIYMISTQGVGDLITCVLYLKAQGKRKRNSPATSPPSAHIAHTYPQTTASACS